MLSKNLHENKLKRAIASPFRNIVKHLSKPLFIKLQYKYITHHKCNLKNPIRYTEKLQHLRLYEYPKNELVSKCAGRVGVRDYLKEKGYENILIPIYGIYDSVEDIPFDELPNQFVMKCSHACAFNKIVTDKNKEDIPSIKNQFAKWLKINYGKKTLELHYSKIKPQIIIEKYIGDFPTEYKIHVFNGKAKYMYVVTGRSRDIKYNNYYIDWTPFDAAQFNGWEKREEKLPIPSNWNEMVKISEDLACKFPFVRVDLYSIDNQIYFSEMTFTPAKGTLIFDDDNADFEIGKWLDINAN